MDLTTAEYHFLNNMYRERIETMARKIHPPNWYMITKLNEEPQEYYVGSYTVIDAPNTWNEYYEIDILKNIIKAFEGNIIFGYIETGASHCRFCIQTDNVFTRFGAFPKPPLYRITNIQLSDK